MTEQVLEASVPEEMAGKRLDQVLAELFDDYSRSRLQKWVKSGKVTVNGRHMAVKEKVTAGDRITLHPEEVPVIEDTAENIALDIIYEDDHLIVINKPAGLVVHPAAGNPSGTLLNGLLHHDPALDTLPRAGIVHRLDKDTSGLLVVARSQRAHKSLIDMLQKRDIHREYRAIVTGLMVAGGTVDEPIGRHPTQRTRMAVLYNESAKPAMTDYRVLERFRAHCLLQVKLHSGRTHQIRVHMAHIRHPVVGDPLYGGRLKIPSGCSEALREALRGFRRQALHAFRLGLEHPVTGEPVEWEAPLPDDMERLLCVLREDAQHA
ncbi:MAG: 23S rRNA pseudouridine(1911/1915/1917) synthase RluD [Gammaproteobacteria bacterium]